MGSPNWGHTLGKWGDGLYTVGIWEDGPLLSGILIRSMAGLGRAIRLCPAQEIPDGVVADLLVAAPDLSQTPTACPGCRALLVPGTLSAPASRIPAGWVVSYGISPRDSLTLSSLHRQRLCIALQRELVTLDGVTLDRQEFPLSPAGHTSPLRVLACVGAMLLLGIPPQEMAVAPLRRPAQGREQEMDSP